MSIVNINNVEISNCIIDELHVRSAVDGTVNLTSSKDDWQMDTYFLAKFKGNLEAGNITNEGYKIAKFVIKRRKVNELNSLTIGNVDYIEGETFTFTDYTQANDTYIYGVYPVGENGIEGAPNEIVGTSDFTGYFVVDKDTNEVLSFDKTMDSGPMVDMQLNQGRYSVETFSKYPSVYYNETLYHTFTLSAVMIPDDLTKSGDTYLNILNKFIVEHKPMIIKSGNGEVYVCDLSNLRKSSPLNTWNGYDYLEISIDCQEIDDYDTFIES